ncbi:hypothetical protein [Rhodoligotrophos defluvii]|uniref:hypothetical protein n=1 Tax=Rhodoligotrophos defluvii TaxID=2561934 RepID=UPI00195F8B45|nr:hypothetical protein [Rhodoligotrophos defluvii]
MFNYSLCPSEVRSVRQLEHLLLQYTVVGLVGLMTISSAQAAGGAHVIDDAGVETPGVCHLETWVSRHNAQSGLAALALACTFEAWPRMEFGGSIGRAWGEGADTSFGPALKLNLIPLETGLGLGVISSAAWSAGSGQIDAASVIVPVSLQLHERVRANFNAGWLYARSDARQNQAFIGAQIETDIANGWMLMGEVFTHDIGQPGAQFGLRWSPGQGSVDLDILSGWRTDGATPWTVTLGVTIRR